jgi:L-rhamnose mutarotase
MERVSFVMRVKEGQQDEYIRRHQEIWPEVLDEHRRAGITKLAIYLHGSDLFLYMEVEDYAKAVEILTTSPAALRWEEYMAPIMEACNDERYDPLNAFPGSLPEVFYWAPTGCQAASRLPAASHNNSPQHAPVKT